MVFLWFSYDLLLSPSFQSAHPMAPRNYGTQVAVGVARAVLARHLCLELERVRLVSWGALLEEPRILRRFMSCTVANPMVFTLWLFNIAMEK